MPAGQRGAILGLATWTKGFGLLVGANGYQVLWPICTVPIVALLMRAEARGTARGRPA